jgi:hypothetical protein
MKWKLIEDKTGNVFIESSGSVVAGDSNKVTGHHEITSFRGEDYVLIGGRPPHNEASTGRVFVRHVHAPPHSQEESFYPGVFSLTWKRVYEPTEVLDIMSSVSDDMDAVIRHLSEVEERLTTMLPQHGDWLTEVQKLREQMINLHNDLDSISIGFDVDTNEEFLNGSAEE